MARARVAPVPTAEASPFNVIPRDTDMFDGAEDFKYRGVNETESENEEEPDDDQMSESGSNATEKSEDGHKDISQSVMEDMIKFEESFKGITKQYRLIDRIGEGTFSTVYKAEDLLYDQHENDWDLDAGEATWISPPVRRGRTVPQKENRRYVAIKKIYVTSSPSRIQNELELLHDLRACKAICPLITAFRYQDQVVAILPYYRHHDFREFFRHMVPSDIQLYFRSMFTALAAVHKQGILHRDIKPTNFLYDAHKQRGVLVDFGLAEREGTESSYCLCTEANSRRRIKVDNSYAMTHSPPHGYPKNDTRPSRRANRAGTRGFRAPEVLLKCTSQTTKIDIWSAGVILLTILSQRFPFFNSTDDIDAMIEISSVFGRRKMANCALLHGAVYECTIPTVGEKGFSLEKLILWSTSRTEDSPGGKARGLSAGEKAAVTFLECCLELNPANRISAKQALQHEFLRQETVFDEDDLGMIGE